MVFGLRLLIHVSLKGFVWEVYGLLICRDYVKLLIEHTTSSMQYAVYRQNIEHHARLQTAGIGIQFSICPEYGFWLQAEFPGD